MGVCVLGGDRTQVFLFVSSRYYLLSYLARLMNAHFLQWILTQGSFHFQTGVGVGNVKTEKPSSHLRVTPCCKCCPLVRQPGNPSLLL